MQVLQGSLVALVTPMLPNGDVDYSCLENLIDWHIGQGTDGIVSVGTTGESATLNVKEHLDVIAFTINHTNKRIPVIAGSGANSTREAIDLTKESKRHRQKMFFSPRQRPHRLNPALLPVLAVTQPSPAGTGRSWH